jgi:hypothetical protein
LCAPQRVNVLINIHTEPNAMTLSHPQQTLLATPNESHGFYGTMGPLAPAAWPVALMALVTATHQSPQAIRLFLDSTYGRHFANSVLNACHGAELAVAIAATVQDWMQRPLSRAEARTLRPPRGGSPFKGPYLVRLIRHCQTSDESAGETTDA